MNQAIVDPAELRRFAQTLRRFNEDLMDRTAGVSGQLSSPAQSLHIGREVFRKLKMFFITPRLGQ